VRETKKFLKKMVGTKDFYTSDELRSSFRGIVLSAAKTLIANAIVKENISILEIASHLSSLSEAIEEKATVAFEDYGLRISDFRIISIHTDDENPAVQQLRDALSERAKLDILGTSFTQSRSFEVLEQAAGNEGAAGNVMGAGIGMGMGVGMGIPMGGQMGNVAGNVDPTASATRTTTCDKCGAVIPGNVRFCPSCGDSVDRCLHCGADNDASAMTCRSCHKALASSAPSATCGKCGVQNPGGAKFCSACGTLITASSPAACSNCNGPLSAGAVFCPGCGTKVSTEESEDS
jgi:membrane protease subunit (stomatin/prohibitin family)